MLQYSYEVKVQQNTSEVIELWGTFSLSYSHQVLCQYLDQNKLLWFFPVQQILSGTLSFAFNATHCSVRHLGIWTKKDEETTNR